MPLPPASPTRRRVLGGMAASLAGAALARPAAAGPATVPAFGPARPFSFDLLAAQAEALSQKPYTAYVPPHPELLDKIDYDAHWRIRFRPEATVMAGPVPLQFFHMGLYFRAPVAMHVVENGESREVLYSADYFDMPKDSPARAIEGEAGFAGFRIMRPDLKTDWISFLGAAYFRTDGADRQYGLSARGVALNTGMAMPEEFPSFTAFWIEGASDGTATIYALMDGPSVTGAFRMSGRDADGQVLDVKSRLYFRQPVGRLGIAPLTSMYWYSESNRLQGFDWRPEVHDSDGLSMVTGTGEHIWRPLNDPDRIVTSSFVDRNPKGFGLIQRDRAFENYQDDGVFYNKRPSVWVEPVNDWGNGAVQLVEIPTDDEIFDNVVAFWVPEAPPQAGSRYSHDYRLYWGRQEPGDWPFARTVATRIGRGGVPGQPRPEGQIKVAIDFAGASLKGLAVKDNLKPMVSAPAGVEIINPYLLPVVGTERWRLIFDIRAPEGADTVDLRAYLARSGAPLSETWLGQVHPAQVLRLGRH